MSHQMNMGYSAPVSPCPIKMILLGHRTMSLEQKYHVKRYFYKQYMHVECLTTRSMDKISEYLMMLQVLWVLASHVLIAGQIFQLSHSMPSFSSLQSRHKHKCPGMASFCNGLDGYETWARCKTVEEWTR